MKSPITTHILDTSKGRPAAGVPVVLEKLEAGAFVKKSSGITDADGRVTTLLKPGELTEGRWQLRFDVSLYLKESFYSDIPVIFSVTRTDEHYHVPLLLNPYGYSTYRGS